MSVLGRTLTIKGEVRASEDVTVEGRIEGPLLCDGFAVTIADSARVAGDVLARDITVFGASDGRLIATEVVDLRPAADVTGHVIAARFILNDGATFNGRAEPQHLEAALRVARYQQKQDPPAAGSSGRT